MKIFRKLFVRSKTPQPQSESVKGLNDRQMKTAPLFQSIETKECRKCFKVKSVEHFHIHNTSKDGRQSYCKGCCKKASRAAWKKQQRRQKNGLLKQGEYATKVMTVKDIPAQVHQRLTRLQEQRGWKQQELFFDMIETYLTLNDGAERVESDGENV